MDTKDRLNDLAELFAKQPPGAHIFNDVHHAMALAGTGRLSELTELRTQLAELANKPVRYGTMLSDAGMPVVNALLDFAQGRFDQSAQSLEDLGVNEALMTGSLAQREVLELTRIEAQIRAGRLSDARQSIAAKLSAKPQSAKWQNEASRV